MAAELGAAQQQSPEMMEGERLLRVAGGRGNYGKLARPLTQEEFDVGDTAAGPDSYPSGSTAGRLGPQEPRSEGGSGPRIAGEERAARAGPGLGVNGDRRRWDPGPNLRD